ncbi:hypothetical protein F4677DRAFT_398462 [Hypoxylon crocopeplum]|nr:hypothetical protein F4677DRAFT_398462 [Hypoxylon crocopeplum]
MSPEVFSLMRLGLITFIIRTVLACSDKISVNETGLPRLIIGPEGSDPATTAYQLNHASLNVRNLTRSLDFYNRIFGMRHMYTVQVTEHFYTAYMGHSSGGRNGTGYQTTAELIRNQANSQGLLELLYVDIEDDYVISPSTDIPNTFSHLGFIVPDIDEAQNRLEVSNVSIYKRVGEPFPRDGPVINAGVLNRSRFSQEEFESIIAGMSESTKGFILAADPDGNMIEIVPQSGLNGV